MSELGSNADADNLDLMTITYNQSNVKLVNKPIQKDAAKNQNPQSDVSPKLDPSKALKEGSSKLLVKQKDRYEINTIEKGMFTGDQDSVNQLQVAYNTKETQMKNSESTDSFKKRRPFKLQPLESLIKNKSVKLIDSQDLTKQSHLVSTNKNFIRGERVTQITAAQITNLNYFSRQPIPENKKFSGMIKRNRSCMQKLYPKFDLFLNQQLKYVLTSKRKSCTCFSTYMIGTKSQLCHQNDSQYAGTLYSNFSGSEFNLYEQCDGLLENLATIYYCSSSFCDTSPRIIEVYVLSPYGRYQDLAGYSPQGKVSLRALYQIQENRDYKKIIKIVTKSPTWNAATESWILNFHGKARYSSVKNMILVEADNENRQVMLVAKAANNIYNVDIAFPLSPRVAMAILSSSFDFKWASQ